MEGGRGGVVYGEKEALESNLPSLRDGGQIILPDDSEISADSETNNNTPTVGMPLSELPSKMPSSVNSENGEADIEQQDGDNDELLKQSEFQCKCLELIMPLTNGGGDSEQQKDGFGTKTLPNGTTVRVNYEKMLENEATKRILLQRTVETYEHTIETLKGKHQASMHVSQEQEIQLASANNKTLELTDLVARLQDEKENMIQETQLFEAELASAVSDKEYLEREVESIQQDTKAKEEYYLKNVELQKKIEIQLQESEAEKTLLVDQVEMLQSDLSGVQTERDGLNEKIQQQQQLDTSTEVTSSQVEELNCLNESLQQELLEKNNEIEQLNDQLRAPSSSVAAAAEVAAVAPLSGDNTNLREEYSLLQDENESLRTLQRDRDLQISELKMTIDSLGDDDSDEADKLAAEVASLTYELGVKTTECEESMSSLQVIQTKLNDAEARLVTIQTLETQIQSLNAQVAESFTLQEELSQVRKSLDNKGIECTGAFSALQLVQDKLVDAESRLVATESSETENSLSQQLAVLRDANSMLEGQKSSRETTLVEQSSTIQGLEKQLQAKETISSNLRDELSREKECLEAKVQQCDTISSSHEQLKIDLLNVQSDRDVIVAKNQESTAQAKEQIARLQTQVADLLKDHNATMKDVEEQLTSSLQQNSTFHKQCEEYRMKLESAESKCSNMSKVSDEAIAQYIDQVSKLKARNLELSATLELKSETNNDIASLQYQLEQQEKEASEVITMWEARCSELEGNGKNVIRQWEERVQSLEATNKQLEGKSLELATTLQTTTIALEAKQLESTTEDNSKVIKLQKSIDAMKLEMDSIAHRHQELLDKNHSLMQEKSDIARSSEAKIVLAEEQVDAMKQECGTLQFDLGISQKATLESKQIVSDLTLQIQSLKDSNTKLEGKLQFEASFAEKDDNVSEFETMNELRDELTSIQEEREQIDLDNEELLVQLGLMQQDKLEKRSEMEVEVEILREKVTTLQEQCTLLQNELKEAKGQTISSGGNDTDESKVLRATIDQVRAENGSLMDQTNSLTERIKELEDQVVHHQVGSRDNRDDQGEIKSMRQELESLEMKLADKELELESTTKQLQHQLDSRDSEIFKLVNECSSKEKELEKVSRKLDAANEEMNTFGSKLETLQDQIQDDVAEDDDDNEHSDDDDESLQDLLAEAVLDSDDYLRSQIVVLAQALEQSELQRANAIDRILKERQSNAESLRQLGESVKRFYTVVK